MQRMRWAALILLMVISPSLGQAEMLAKTSVLNKPQKQEQVVKKKGAMIKIGSVPYSKDGVLRKGAALKIGSYPLTES